MTIFKAHPGTAPPQPAREDSTIASMMKEFIFEDPSAVFDASVRLLNRISAGLKTLISAREFEYLLGYAALRSDVELGLLDYELLSGRAIPVRGQRSRNLGVQEQAYIGIETARLLVTLQRLLASLIGDVIVSQQFRLALTPRQHICKSSP